MMARQSGNLVRLARLHTDSATSRKRKRRMRCKITFLPHPVAEVARLPSAGASEVWRLPLRDLHHATGRAGLVNGEDDLDGLAAFLAIHERGAAGRDGL